MKAASDLTNELLQANAENLQTANAEVRRQVERGVFDIETVKEANAKLVATINESLQIADEGKRRRRPPSRSCGRWRRSCGRRWRRRRQGRRRG